MKRMIVATFAVLLVLFASSASACPGVTYNTLSDSSWTVHTFSGPNTDEVEFDVSAVTKSGTVIEVYANGAWSTVGVGTHTGSMLRHTNGGGVDATYRVGECEDIIEPNDN